MHQLLDKRKQDIIGIVFLSSGLFLAIALFTFNPSDPSLNSVGKGLLVTNYCGYAGSFLSDALYQILGLSAWLFVGGFFWGAILNFRGKSPTIKNLRFIWSSILLLTVVTLLSAYFPDVKIFRGQISIGGLLGLGFYKTLTYTFNKVGAQIILWAAVAMLTIFYSEKTVQELIVIPQRILIRAKKSFPFLSNFITWLLERQKSKSKLSLDKKVSETERQIQSITAPEKSDLNNKQEDDTMEEAESKAASDKRGRTYEKKFTQSKVENWMLPKLSLLEDPPISRLRPDEKETKRKAEILKEKLAHFKVTGSVVAAKPGPAVTMFEFRPDANVKVSEVTALADDLSLALSSESLRILAPIPGRDVVGIETSNAGREVVYLKDMLTDKEFWKDEIKLPITLGKTSTGEPRVIDLRRLPHLMVAGTTGSGKSVFTVSIITGLLFRHSPKTLRLIIVDPKQVDYVAFENIPHLVLPLISETKQAVVALRWAVNEMEKRYRSMSKFGARGLEAYNESVNHLSKEQIEEHEEINNEYDTLPGKKADKYYYQELPYIVIILEEFGDLMTVDKQNVEHFVVRLAQKARAAGIHLVLAMQSPRREVVTGLIKTNIPGRIAFKVNSGMDSRIILDETGAERLLAQGDMLYKSPGSSVLVRHHGPFLKDSEVMQVTQFWSDQANPEYDASAVKALDGLEDFEAGESNGDASNGREYDERYDEILSWVSSQKMISASLIQRRFSIGYPRAARIIETFEKEGVVGPASGSKPRQVMVSDLSSIN